MNIKELIKNQIVYFDGGMGTLLQERGLQPGELPETWNILHPEIITDIHHSYFEAGANISRQILSVLIALNLIILRKL